MDGSNPAASPPPSPPLGARADWTIDQEWERYTSAEHDVWRTLYERQAALLPSRACRAFLDGLKALDLHGGGIPDFRRVNPQLERLTGWTIVAVPGLIPDQAFFEHLASRRFPAGSFIRKAGQLDYLQEPDVFHDVFGHVPMLTDPAFADYMQAYGAGGLRASRLAHLHHLARLYWYTVEFGLMESAAGLRIYGAGIVSSRSETVFALEDPSPNRLGFDLERVMRTPYRIDDFQQTYFVISSLKALLEATLADFGPLYARLEAAADIPIEEVLASDRVFARGTQAYAMSRLAG
ncbi:MAG: phenylalanine 4-monooxygenase [Caulobacteraceae bacterium]